MKGIHLGILIAAISFGANAFADAPRGELRELYRGARATAMGNAFVALADDEEAIFYNPAGMAGNDGFNLNYLAEDAEISNDDITMTSQSISAFHNLSGDSLNVLMGKNIYAHSQFAPSFTMPGFGLAVLVDDQFAVQAKNQALPQITLGYQETNGIQTAFGFSVLHHGRHPEREPSDLRVGFGLKYMWRRGGYKPLSLAQTVGLNLDEAHQIIGDFGGAFGADLGVQYIRNITRSVHVGAGAAWTEIGDMKFGGQADTQPQNLSMGVYGQFAPTKLTKVTATYDLRNLTETADFSKKNHFGVEFALPIFSVQAGINESTFTYGFGVDLWLLNIQAVSYTEQIASSAGLDPERRYLLHIGMKLGI